MSTTHHGLLIHVIFSTKLRAPILNPAWHDDLFAYMGGTARDHQAIILAAGGIEDHVHLLIKIHPSRPLSDTVKLIKSNSSRWINKCHNSRRRFQWQRGYGAFSVSQSMSTQVKRYIADQREHHKTRSYREEYLSFLERHAIDFDKRYVFDEEVVA